MNGAETLSTRTPKVSILLTVHNGLPYLEEAIASVLAQTEAELELIIVDDASGDGSASLIAARAKTDARIRTFTTPGVGVAGALIAASAHARGRYVAVVDQDDRLAPTAIEETARVLDEHAEIGWVFTDCMQIDAAGAELGFDQRCFIPFSPARLLIDFVSFHLRLVRRSVLEELGGYRAAFDPCADYDLCLRLSEKSRVARLRRPLYFYRVHATSVTQRAPERVVEASSRAINEALIRRGLDQTHVLEVDAQGRFNLVERL